MVRAFLAFATFAFASGARINFEAASEESGDLVAEVQDEDEDAGYFMELYDDESVGPDSPIIRCNQASAGSRRRNQQDCGCRGGSTQYLECFEDDPHDQCCHYVGSSGRCPYCRRRRSAPPPPPPPRRPPAPPPPPPEYIPGSGRFWEIGSHRSSGTANSPGTVANGWYDPNSEFMLAQSPPANHDGEPYPLAAMTRHDSHDPHHCNSGWASCCNTEFNCCANCPLQNADRPEWGPRGWSQCLGWFPQCGTDAPHPNLPSAPAPSPPGEGGFGGFGDFGGDGGMPGFGGGMPGFGGGGAMPVPGPPPPSMGHHPPPGFGGGTMPNPFGGGFGGFGGFR